MGRQLTVDDVRRALEDAWRHEVRPAVGVRVAGELVLLVDRELQGRLLLVHPRATRVLLPAEVPGLFDADTPVPYVAAYVVYDPWGWVSADQGRRYRVFVQRESDR